jgi:hypothetical protein
MDPRGIAEISVSLCNLMQAQLDSIMNRLSTEFSAEDFEAYQERKLQIAELRCELHRFANPV